MGANATSGNCPYLYVHCDTKSSWKTTLLPSMIFQPPDHATEERVTGSFLGIHRHKGCHEICDIARAQHYVDTSLSPMGGRITVACNADIPPNIQRKETVTLWAAVWCHRGTSWRMPLVYQRPWSPAWRLHANICAVDHNTPRACGHNRLCARAHIFYNQHPRACGHNDLSNWANWSHSVTPTRAWTRHLYLPHFGR
jgi:hypothetical protein